MTSVVSQVSSSHRSRICTVCVCLMANICILFNHRSIRGMSMRSRSIDHHYYNFRHVGVLLSGIFTMCQEGTTEGYENKRNANDADVPSSRTTMTCLYMANERMYSISSLGECKRNQYPLLFFDSSYLVKKHIPRWNEFMTSYDIRLIIISICLCWYVRLMLLLLLLPL